MPGFKPNSKTLERFKLDNERIFRTGKCHFYETFEPKDVDKVTIRQPEEDHAGQIYNPITGEWKWL